MVLNNGIYSPFKFLDSFKKDDFDVFFGRDKESVNLFELYRDTSLIILHGPSGSGKTSLIQCGLLNRLGINNEAIISIRRNENIVNSFAETVFGVVPEKGPANQDTLFTYLQLVEKYNHNLKEIDFLDDIVVTLEEEVSTHKQEQYYYQKRQPEKETGNSLKKETIAGAIEAKEAEINKVLNQKHSLQKGFKEEESTITHALAGLKEYFQKLFKHLGAAPLIIFDQFEELFVYGSQEEINRFGLILKFIFNNNIPINIIISLREEYFGHLDLLQAYIPNIFYKKIRLSHPNRDTVEEIIERSFEKFNINKYLDHNSIGQASLLPFAEKKQRVNLIIDQIAIKEDNLVSYHLPFLQVYLDRLYKTDYHKTYGNGIPGGFAQKYGQNLPLEFKTEEILEFGSIENVLEKYIREINDDIVKNPENKLNDQRLYKNATIKFLRHFKTKEDIKKRVPITIEKDLYIISDKAILLKIEQDIWGAGEEKGYESTISEMIKKLQENGIFNIGSDYVELSHDMIARVISRIKIEEDFLLLLKNDFNTSFEIYNLSKDHKDLLNEQQLMRMYLYKDFILTDENPLVVQEKRAFFKESREKVDTKNRKEIREKEEQNRILEEAIEKQKVSMHQTSLAYKKSRRYFNWARIVSVVMVITTATTVFYFLKNLQSKKILQDYNSMIDFQLKQLNQSKQETDSIRNELTQTILNQQKRIDSISNNLYSKKTNLNTATILKHAENSQYLVTIYGFEITPDDEKRLLELFKEAGYSATIGGTYSKARPTWMAATPTLLYYSNESKEKAMQCRDWLIKNTRLKWAIQRGNGLGVIKGQEANTFFVHFAKPTKRTIGLKAQ